MALDDIESLDPRSTPIKLASGSSILVERLRMRQLFKLLRIVSHGAGQALLSTRLNLAEDTQEELAIKLMSLLMLSVPDAEEETIDFIRSVTKPYGLAEGRSLSKQDRERNDILLRTLFDELDNPEPDDFLSIIEVVVKNEIEDVQALGKRLAATLKMAQKVGEPVPVVVTETTVASSPPESQEPISSVELPEPMTSSPQNMDGQMELFPTSPSGVSGSA